MHNLFSTNNVNRLRYMARAPDTASLHAHHMFYVVVQAVMYVVCFRIEDIAATDGLR